MNPIYLRRRSKVTVPDGTGATPINVLASLQKNLESLGFVLSEELTERLKTLNPMQVDALYQRLVKDLKAREVIWADIVLASNPRFANNVHNNLSGVSLMLRAVTQLRQTDLHTLFSLRIRARGEEVPDAGAAESVFAVDRGVTPFDLDRIAAEYM